MKKILIVDDERRIGTLVRNLIRWEELDMECVGVYNDSAEALEGVRLYHPDIVITDIKMPQISGLELIQRAQKMNENLFFIVISGYREFEYAHKALEYGVENYLLKPIDEDELNHVLEKINEKVEKEDIQRKKIEKSVAESNKIIRRDFLKNIIDQSKERTVGTVDLKGNRYRGIDIKFDYADYEKRNTRQDELLVDNVYQIVEECFCDQAEERLICEKDYLHIYCLLNYHAGKTADFYQALNECVLRVKECIMGMDSYQVTIGVGAEKSRFEDIRISILESYRAVCNRLKYGTGRLIFFEDVTAGKEADLDQKIKEVQEDFINSMDAYSVDNVVSLARKTMDSIGRDNMDMLEYYELAEKMLDLFFAHIENAGCAEELPSANCAEGKENLLERDLEKREILGRIWHVKDVFGLRRSLTEGLKTCMERRKESRQMQSVRPIRMAVEYIEKHYAEKLSLDEMAELADLNPVYFSTLFKKETGVNFSAYLTKTRMEHAKQALVETNDTIALIGQSVGYEDQKYFSQAFKKAVGIRPAVYRKMHS